MYVINKFVYFDVIYISVRFVNHVNSCCCCCCKSSEHEHVKMVCLLIFNFLGYFDSYNVLGGLWPPKIYRK